MKDGSDVAICSPGKESDNTDNEEEFKVQGQRRCRSNSDLTDKNAAKKKSNPVTNALPSVVKNSLEPSKPVNKNESNVPPVVIKNFPEFKVLMKRINEVNNLKLSARPVGELVHVFTSSSKGHRELTD